jgi:hypothetical protein
MKNFKIILLFALVVLLFSSCAHVVDVSACVEGTKEYGFWNGLWHGMIAPFTFIGHLFNDEIAVFATNLKGEGGWYYFGFLLGVGAFSSSSSATYKSRK